MTVELTFCHVFHIPHMSKIIMKYEVCGGRPSPNQHRSVTQLSHLEKKNEYLFICVAKQKIQ
jgi:hypothetical protein